MRLSAIRTSLFPDAFAGQPSGRAVAALEPTGSHRHAPRGVVLLMHGGTQRSDQPVDTRSASLWRTTRMRDRVAPRLRKEGYAVWLLRYTVRGWNGGAAPHGDPVPDARWALEQVRAAYPRSPDDPDAPDLPVVLVGHSMGGRTAIAVADDPSVTGVVLLAPWTEAGDPVAPLTGKAVLAAHGRRDRITSAAATRAFLTRAAAVAQRAEFFSFGLAGHYMLWRPGRWNRFVVRRSLEMLEAVSPAPSAAPRSTPR